MFDDLAAYFYEHVVQSFDEYHDAKRSGISGRSRDVRAATAAASALFHLLDHLPTESGMSRTKAERLCSDFGVLADIANTSKHRSITKPTPHGAPLLKSAADLTEEIVITEYCDHDGPYQHAEKRVVAKLTDGSTRDVLEILTNVMNFWQGHLYEKGVVAKPRTYTVVSADGPMARTEANNGRIDFLITPGLRFAGSLRLQKYDYVTGKPEPIDLTDCKAQLQFRTPQQYEVDLSITHESSGTTLKRTIKLTAEESQVFESLRTDEERNAYINGLARTRPEFKELFVDAQALQSGKDE